jgi:hypothetical protein
MNETPINAIGLQDLLLSNLTNTKFDLTETQIHWMTKIIIRPTDMIDNIHVHIQPYQQKKIEIYEIPVLVEIYSKTLCDKSNQLKIFDYNYIIKMVSFIMDVLVCNNILIVNGDISNEQISKLVVNCTSLLNKSIVENISRKTMLDNFAYMYVDFIKVLSEPLFI